jgi:cbb3-type cytochrome oxidase maturation protein
MRCAPRAELIAMDILYLLIPLSTALVLLILGVFAWALHRGQFEDLEREGERILQDEPALVDADQTRAVQRTEQSPTV